MLQMEYHRSHRHTEMDSPVHLPSWKTNLMEEIDDIETKQPLCNSQTEEPVLFNTIEEHSKSPSQFDRDKEKDNRLPCNPYQYFFR